MFTNLKMYFLVHKSEVFFDNLRSTLAPDGVSVNISPDQAVLFMRTPILDAKRFCDKLLAHIRDTFSVDCYIAVTKPLSEYQSFKDAFSFLVAADGTAFFPAGHTHFFTRYNPYTERGNI